MTTKLLKDTAILIGTAATAIALVMGSANATGYKATATVGDVKSKATVGDVNNKQHQKQNQNQTNDIDYSQKNKADPGSPSLALGGAGMASSSTSGVRNACALLYNHNAYGGIGAGLSNGVVTGGIVAGGYGNTRGLLVVNCEISEQATGLAELGLMEAAQKMPCMQEYSRRALVAVHGESFCSGIPVASVAFARSDDEADKNPAQTLVYAEVRQTTTTTTVSAPSAQYQTGSKHPDFADLQ